MSDHPALAHKYAIVQHTRGHGIEVGGGQLYPHFRSPGETEAVGSLDFVFLPEQPIAKWPMLVRDGGHVVHVERGILSIWQVRNQGDIMDRVDLSIDVHDDYPRSACVVRYGGFGDMIQASGILPALRREGFTVYVMTTPKGQEILQHDPHIDGWLIQDTDQVPNPELLPYWEVQAKRFDRFINLSESVEGTLLAYPGRANHAWPLALRQKELGSKNYLEWTAQLAEVEFAPEAKFYPTLDEVKWAQRWLADFKNESLGRPLRPMEHVPARFNILWTLAGSSVHKMYPHQDEVLARVLAACPEACITLCGDQLCELLEQGWENHPRVRCTSGKLSIRETLTLATLMDCVVGPETGVLNAVGFEPMAKVVMLSHSSPQNLTVHWYNTAAITPTGTACYPCHQLHSDRRYCPEHEPTGASMCAFNTEARQVTQAILAFHAQWSRAPVRMVARMFDESRQLAEKVLA